MFLPSGKNSLISGQPERPWHFKWDGEDGVPMPFGLSE